jgi:hypothetical protein
MGTGAWIILALGGALALVTFGLSFIRSLTERAAYKFSTSVGIGLTEEFLPLVRSRLVLQQRGTAITAFLALTLAAIFLTNNAELTGSTFGPLTFVGVLLAGMSAGNAATALRSHAPRDPDRPRLARARVVTVADYVAPLERRGAYIAVTLAIAAMISFLVASGVMRRGPLPWISTPVILGTLAVASLLLFEIAGSRIAHTGQPATSSIELAWDDALRAARLRSLVFAPLIIGAYGTFASLASASTLASAATGGAPVAAGFAFVNLAFTLIAMVVAIIVLIKQPQRFFLRRLWPEAEAVA